MQSIMKYFIESKTDDVLLQQHILTVEKLFSLNAHLMMITNYNTTQKYIFIENFIHGTNSRILAYILTLTNLRSINEAPIAQFQS